MGEVDKCLPLEHGRSVIEHRVERMTNPVSGSKEDFSEIVTLCWALKDWLWDFPVQRRGIRGILSRERNQCKGQ